MALLFIEGLFQSTDVTAKAREQGWDVGADRALRLKHYGAVVLRNEHFKHVTDGPDITLILQSVPQGTIAIDGTRLVSDKVLLKLQAGEELLVPSSTAATVTVSARLAERQPSVESACLEVASIKPGK